MSMMDDNIKRATECGFSYSHSVQLHKTATKWSDTGIFEVIIAPNTPRFDVCKRSSPDGVIEWRCVFDVPEHFQNWAEAYT